MYERLTHQEQNTSRSNKNIEQKSSGNSKKNTPSMNDVLVTIMRIRRNPNSLTGQDYMLLQQSIGNQATQKLLSEIKESQPEKSSQKKEDGGVNNTSSENTYIVKPGDTLSYIANKYNTTVDELVKLNNIKDRNKIYPGQKIILPQKTGNLIPKENKNDSKNEKGNADKVESIINDDKKSDDSSKDKKSEEQTPYADFTRKQKEEVVFGKDGKYYKTESEASKNMVTITVKVWNYDKEGKLYTSKVPLTINKNLQDDVKAIFNEIYESDEKFPIKSLGGYNFRKMAASSNLSHHSYGTAIDINPDENYMIKDKKIIAGKLYEPGQNKYSMPADGIVVKIFKKHGWIWGGDWKSSKDYMHFSFLGN